MLCSLLTVVKKKKIVQKHKHHINFIKIDENVPKGRIYDQNISFIYFGKIIILPQNSSHQSIQSYSI